MVVQTTVNFNINTLDASGFEELLVRSRGTITQLINNAVNERGECKYNLMAGAFPISSAQLESLGIKSIQNTIISKSVSGKKLARQIDGQRWGFTARIITAKRSDVYGELMAFIIKQRSGKENFTISPTRSRRC
jgi:hypothetical protein